MVALLKPKKVPILGVDVSSTSVKILELSKTSKDSYRVESYAVEPLPANAVTEKNIQDIEAVGESLKRAVKKSGTKAKHAALAVAGSAVITKKIIMPSPAKCSSVPSCLAINVPISAWYSWRTAMTSSGSALSANAVKPRRSR